MDGCPTGVASPRNFSRFGSRFGSASGVPSASGENTENVAFAGVSHAASAHSPSQGSSIPARGTACFAAVLLPFGVTLSPSGLELNSSLLRFALYCDSPSAAASEVERARASDPGLLQASRRELWRVAASCNELVLVFSARNGELRPSAAAMWRLRLANRSVR